MKPARFEVVGQYLAVLWEGGEESIIPLRQLRERCPCAGCSGEVDITGRRHLVGPAVPLGDSSFEVSGWDPVGHYAVQLKWGDGHDTGIYSYDLLYQLAEA